MVTAVIGDNTGDDYTGTEDTYLNAGATTTNYGSSTTMWITRFGANDRRNCLLSFSGLSNIPSSASVSSVTMGAYMNLADSTSSRTLRMKRALVNWVEAQATWNDYATSTAWTGAGCTSDGNDRSSTVSIDKAFATTTSQYFTFSSAQLATDVGNFVDGTWSNYGWYFGRDDDTTYDGYYNRFVTSDGTDGQRPYLSVTYTVPAGSPLISKLSLLGVGI